MCTVRAGHWSYKFCLCRFRLSLAPQASANPPWKFHILGPLGWGNLLGMPGRVHAVNFTVRRPAGGGVPAPRGCGGFKYLTSLGAPMLSDVIQVVATTVAARAFSKVMTNTKASIKTIFCTNCRV